MARASNPLKSVVTQITREAQKLPQLKDLDPASPEFAKEFSQIIDSIIIENGDRINNIFNSYLVKLENNVDTLTPQQIKNLYDCLSTLESLSDKYANREYKDMDRPKDTPTKSDTDKYMKQAAEAFKFLKDRDMLSA